MVIGVLVGCSRGFVRAWRYARREVLAQNQASLRSIYHIFPLFANGFFLYFDSGGALMGISGRLLKKIDVVKFNSLPAAGYKLNIPGGNCCFTELVNKIEFESK